eukprot:7391435-Prymnesium_polylepis.3
MGVKWPSGPPHRTRCGANPPRASTPPQPLPLHPSGDACRAHPLEAACTQGSGLWAKEMGAPGPKQGTAETSTCMR